MLVPASRHRRDRAMGGLILPTRIEIETAAEDHGVDAIQLQIDFPILGGRGDDDRQAAGVVNGVGVAEIS